MQGKQRLFDALERVVAINKKQAEAELRQNFKYQQPSILQSWVGGLLLSQDLGWDSQ